MSDRWRPTGTHVPQRANSFDSRDFQQIAHAREVSAQRDKPQREKPQLEKPQREKPQRDQSTLSPIARITEPKPWEELEMGLITDRACGFPHGVGDADVDIPSLRLSVDQNNRIPNVCFRNQRTSPSENPGDSQPLATVAKLSSRVNLDDIPTPLLRQFQIDQKIEALLARVAELERNLTPHEASAGTSVCTPNKPADELLISESQVEALLAQWRERVNQLELENADLLAQVRGNIHKQVSESLATELESLRAELRDQRSQNAEMQQRNVELTKRIQNVGSSHRLGSDSCNNSLSWEEMKQSWLEQLEEEMSAGETANSDSKWLEIQSVVEKSNAEIDRRDLEIAELRHLLSEQAVATQGIAVGAAAIAAQLDLDDCIREERERLRAQQEEWDHKHRQAEVEMSLERARLSRERIELFETMQNIEAMQHDSREWNAKTTEIIPAGEPKPRGRWLKKLGLQEK